MDTQSAWEVQYVRELDRSYLVIRGAFAQETYYALRMLEENQIPGLAKLQLQKMDDRICLYFDVTGKLPMDRIYDPQPMSEPEIRLLLGAISDVAAELKNYLIKDTDLLLDPSFVYLDADRQEFVFCCIPGFDSASDHSFASLAEFVLRRLDPSDPAAVQLGHAFFTKAEQGLRGIQELRETAVAADTDRSLVPERGTDFPSASLLEKQRNFSAVDLLAEEEPEGTAQGTERAHDNRWLTAAVCGSILALTVLYGAAVWFFSLDLAQAGALAAALIALVWLICGALLRERKDRSIWGDMKLGEEESEEAAFMAALMSADEEPCNSVLPIPSHEELLSQEAQELFAMKKLKEADHAKKKDSSAYHSEETRLLGDAQHLPKVMLISKDMGRCKDIRIENKRVLIGKNTDQVDICIPLDVMSRIHAKLEIEEDGCWLEDLNSSNGTFIGNERLAPFERKKISQSGTDIAFANVQFRLVYR